MKKIKELLEGLKYEVVTGDIESEVDKVIYDTRKVEDNSIFICIKGANFDSHDKVQEIIQKGAGCIVVSKDVEAPDYKGTIIKVDDTRLALAYISANYFGNPASKIKTIGVTGTKGKTTTTYLVKSMLENAGLKVGLIGTIEIITATERIHSVNTTPESYVLQEYLAKMADEGLDAVVMEVSSQALMLHRVGGFTFDIGVFTNLESDHIGPNEHSSFEEYRDCKKLLFSRCKTGIFNVDDGNAGYMMNGATCQCIKYGIEKDGDYKASDIKYFREDKSLNASFKLNGEVSGDFTIDMPGKFSVYNALTAIAIAHEFGVSNENIQKALMSVKVKGRVERVDVKPGATFLIDYAHNAMALSSLLETLKIYNPERLICLFGCGGNRSKERRYEMGEVSGKMADLSIVTSDNPRFEEPEEIIEDILSTLVHTGGKFVKITDRKEAIKYAIEIAEAGDIVVLAGKGHEDYQEIKGVKYPMDERVVIHDLLEEMNING